MKKIFTKILKASILFLNLFLLLMLYIAFFPIDNSSDQLDNSLEISDNSSIDKLADQKSNKQLIINDFINHWGNFNELNDVNKVDKNNLVEFKYNNNSNFIYKFQTNEIKSENKSFTIYFMNEYGFVTASDFIWPGGGGKAFHIKKGETLISEADVKFIFGPPKFYSIDFD